MRVRGPRRRWWCPQRPYSELRRALRFVRYAHTETYTSAIDTNESLTVFLAALPQGHARRAQKSHRACSTTAAATSVAWPKGQPASLACTIITCILGSFFSCIHGLNHIIKRLALGVVREHVTFKEVGILSVLESKAECTGSKLQLPPPHSRARRLVNGNW